MQNPGSDAGVFVWWVVRNLDGEFHFVIPGRVPE